MRSDAIAEPPPPSKMHRRYCNDASFLLQVCPNLEGGGGGIECILAAMPFYAATKLQLI